MEQIKENMFFVVTGAIVLLCIVFYFNPFFSVRSWENENVRLEGEVKKLEGQLDSWIADKIVVKDKDGKTQKTLEGPVLSEDSASLVIKTAKGKEKVAVSDIVQRTHKEFVPNQSALKAADDYQKSYKMMFEGGKDANGAEVEGVKNIFEHMVLQTRLKNLDPTAQDTPPEFLNQYRKLIDELKKEMRDNGIRTDADTWKFWSWGSDLPYDKLQRDEATREYWLSSEVLDVIQQPSLKVVALDRIEVEPGSDKTEKAKLEGRVMQRKGDYFDAIPFVLEVKMQFQSVPELVGKLLTMSTPVFIDGISISRLTEDQRVAVKARDLRMVIVNVKLSCQALNYRVAPAQALTGAAVAAKKPAQ